jgi:hypothetical protein
MKTIKTTTYENLKPSQRVIAIIEAIAREDSEESQRLLKTCPRKNYAQADAEFSDKLEQVFIMALAVECDLRGHALNFFMALRIEHEAIHKLLQNYADTLSAWHQALKSIGIEPETMRKAGPPRNFILEMIEEIMPEPVEENVNKLSAEIIELFKKT